MKPVTRELLASREDAWGFLAEPYHLSDWWPGMLSVEPDRRGFAPGARWQVAVYADPLRIGPLRFPQVGRPSGPSARQTLVIVAIEPFERWEWNLIRRLSGPGERTATRSVEIVLRELAPDKTEAAVSVVEGTRPDPRLARTAVDRLYDLVQTAAAL
ncbi:MAG TPA: hypothetical protein VH063_10210 [Gaiellaceae bacterium]|jgi:hypothetical protein|nr:hypothetical protein [Gaiellaceae bacterium]